MIALLLALVAGAAPSDQTLIYYNARMALREGEAGEALKLWLLRNAVESRTGVVSPHDPDLRSVTWAALGELGLCQDGLPADEDGAGLWPLAQHNWLVRDMRRPPSASGGSPFEAFAIGRQQRFVSVRDVLDAEELRGVQFGRTGCLARLGLLYRAGEYVLDDRADRRVDARLLRHLLRTALRSLDGERVIGRAAVAARIFDLDLRLVGLEDRAARRKRRARQREARRLGVAGGGGPRFPPDSEAGQILRESLRWSAEEWMTLSSQRRQFLAAHAMRNAEHPAAARPTLLAVIDALIEQRRGNELHSWIAHLGGAEDTGVRRQVWAGDRGRRLLALDEATGFRERGAIALHRGVHALEAGRLPEALRAFAQAMRWAERSRRPEAVRALGRRWLSFVASRFRVTDALFAMLEQTLPRADHRAVLEDQTWHAVLQADLPSFERCVGQQRGRGASLRRAATLRPLARGDVDGFLRGVDDLLADAPHHALRLLQTYLERLQTQRVAVREQHRPLMERLRPRLAALSRAGAEGRRGLRRAGALLTRIDAVLGGLAGAAVDPLAPDQRVFAGSVRVAPADELPWPFTVAEVQSPPVFTPIRLRPEEWRDGDGALVFGWRVGD